MGLKTILAFVILMIVVICLGGCNGDEEEFKPSVSLSLDDYNLKIDNNALSKFLTATVTRTDDKEQEMTFTLKFRNLASVYATDVDGNKIEELSTKPLKGLNSKDILQFKVFGGKGEATEASFDLWMELWWNNNTKIENQDQKIEIKIK